MSLPNLLPVMHEKDDPEFECSLEHIILHGRKDYDQK